MAEAAEPTAPLIADAPRKVFSAPSKASAGFGGSSGSHAGVRASAAVWPVGVRAGAGVAPAGASITGTEVIDAAITRVLTAARGERFQPATINAAPRSLAHYPPRGSPAINSAFRGSARPGPRRFTNALTGSKVLAGGSWLPGGFHKSPSVAPAAMRPDCGARPQR